MTKDLINHACVMKTPFKKKKTERTGFQWVNTWRFNLHGDSGTVVQTETRLVSPEPKFLNINFTASKSLASLDRSRFFPILRSAVFKKLPLSHSLAALMVSRWLPWLQVSHLDRTKSRGMREASSSYVFYSTSKEAFPRISTPVGLFSNHTVKN